MLCQYGIVFEFFETQAKLVNLPNFAAKFGKLSKFA